jgi:hypothetical protein
MKTIKERVDEVEKDNNEDIFLGSFVHDLLHDLRSDLREAVEGKRLGKYDVHPQVKEFTNVGNYNQALDEVLSLLDELEK